MARTRKRRIDFDALARRALTMGCWGLFFGFLGVLVVVDLFGGGKGAGGVTAALGRDAPKGCVRMPDDLLVCDAHPAP